jgi:hypothetical protein
MKKYLVLIGILLQTMNNLVKADELEPDQIIKLDGKITVSQESDLWLRVTVPFMVKQHPELLKLGGKRPESIEELFNPDFLDSLKIKIWISFLNEFNRYALKGERKDVRFFDYFSAELECMAIEVDRKTKKAEFLLPVAIAKMRDWGNNPKPTGYVIEFSRRGKIFSVSDSITFLNFDQEDYLEKYRMEAVNNSSKNEGMLIPAYLINANYLKDLGPVVRD